MKSMTVEDVKKMDYSTMVGFLGERNRPSGGIKTIQEACVNCFINSNSRVLEIGSNTGFTSVNINLLTKATVLGLDINEVSVQKAKKYASKMGSSSTFVVGSATEIPFEDKSFDVVWASNVTSFIEDKERALFEYERVLKDNGFLVFIPIYYRKNPPKDIVKEVSNSIGSEINIKRKEDWVDFVVNSNSVFFEKVYSSDYIYLDQQERIESYIERVFEDSGFTTNSFEEKTYQELISRYKYFIGLFNENLKYCGYSIFVFQKRKLLDQEELFLSEKI